MRSLTISGGDEVVDLYPWLTAVESGSPDSNGIEALAGIAGFGIPGVTPRWFNGAGQGSSWRGSRVQPRKITIPVIARHENREGLLSLLSRLSIALDPDLGESTLRFGMPGGDTWSLRVVRSEGVDWSRKNESDDERFFKTSISLTAGDPFWVRDRPEEFEIKRPDDAPGLLPELAELKVGRGSAFGIIDVNNIGDTRAWPVWRVEGPTTKVILVGADGERLEWTGALLAGQSLTIDARENTVVDGTGANRYSNLAPAPRFWSIRPKASQVTIEALGATGDTSVSCLWWPRRQAVL